MSERRYVMLSYNWSHQEIVNKIRYDLCKDGYRVWIYIGEEDGMKDFIYTDTSNAVKEAEVVVCCVSQKYQKSDNCQLEGGYIGDYKKNRIALKMEAGYELDEWVKGLFAGHLYIDFSDATKYEEKFKELLICLKRYPALNPQKDNRIPDYLPPPDATPEPGIPSVPLEVRAKGPDSINAYNNAIKEGSKRIYQTRLMFVGPERVGKTSLIKALTGDEFDDTEDATDGIDTSTLSCKLSVKHVANWKPKPTEGGARQQYVRAVAEIVVAKLQQQELESQSTRSETSHLSPAQPHVTDLDKLVKKSMAEKSPDKIVPSPDTSTSQDDSTAILQKTLFDEVIQLVLKIVKKEEKETDDDLTLSIWDFAGQDLYYLTHPVFLVSRAIYIICFNLCLDLNEPAKIEIYRRDGEKISVSEHHMNQLDFIIFWVRSIYSHTPNQELSPPPPVYVIGTHKDSLPGNDDQEKLEIAEKIFDAIQEKLEGTPYENLIVQYYAVDNKPRPLDKSIIELREEITKAAKNEHYMGEQIPITWLDFLREIEQMCIKKHSVSFKEVEKVAEKCGVKHETELFTLLHFYHELGNIIYYGKQNTQDALNDIIILNSNWLIDIFRRVFTVKRRSKRDKDFRKSWRKLDDEGLLEEKLIRHKWSEFLPQLESLLQLMQKFDLLCMKIKSSENQSCGRLFYTPSLLKKHDDDMENIDKLVKPVLLYIDFNGFLPEGLFYQLIVRLLQWSQEHGGEPKLYYQQADMQVDKDHNMIVRILPKKRSVIQVAINYASSGECKAVDPNPAVCKKVLTILEKNLTNLGCTWKKRIDFCFSIMCSVCKQKQKLHFHELSKCLEIERVYCGMKRMETKVIASFFEGWKSTKASMDTENREPSTSSTSSSLAALTEDVEELSTSPKPSTELSEENYQQLLVDVSSWWQVHGSTDMLKVLLRQFNTQIALTLIEEKHQPYDLFQLLEGPGLISRSNVDVLIEATALAGLNGVEEKIMKQLPSFPGFNQIVIRIFSQHRINLIKFGLTMTDNKKDKIGHLYSFKGTQLTNPWVLILELEKNEKLTAETKELFIKKLEENEMEKEAAILKRTKLPE